MTPKTPPKTARIPHGAILAASPGSRIPEIYRSRVLPVPTRTTRRPPHGNGGYR